LEKVLITLFALHCLLPFEATAVAFLIRHTNDLGGMALCGMVAWWIYKMVEILPPPAYYMNVACCMSLVARRSLRMQQLLSTFNNY